MRFTGDILCGTEKITAEGHSTTYLSVAIHDEDCPHDGTCKDPEVEGCHAKDYSCEFITLGFDTRAWLRKVMDVFDLAQADG